MNVNIPEEPDDTSIKAVLGCMERCTRQRMRLENHEEVARLRGTPGEPIPQYDVGFYEAVRFMDDKSAESPVMTFSAAERVNSGEPVEFRVIKNRATPDAPPDSLFYTYLDPDFRIPAPVGRVLWARDV